MKEFRNFMAMFIMLIPTAVIAGFAKRYNNFWILLAALGWIIASGVLVSKKIRE